jgi:hypothetical protein
LGFSLSGGVLPGNLKAEMKMRYKEVPTVGKVRPMGIPDVQFDLLAPLHKAIYQHLSSKDWLLVGPPTAKKVERTCKGIWQTSVDLTAATDGLRLDATEVILSALLSKASSIPGKVRELAHMALRPTIELGSSHPTMDRVETTHGQQMGSYMSFPLLCLSSYCAARWAARDDENATFLVNGDDVLISSMFKNIKNNYDPGFSINESKTGVFKNVAEINSTTFLRQGGKWREVRHMKRGGGVVDEVEGIRHIAGACIKAGAKWISAFIHSRIGKRYHITPSSLGIDVDRNRDAWQRERMMTKKAVFPVVRGPLDERLVPSFDPLDFDETEALRNCLFNEGRMKVKREYRRSFCNKLVVIPDLILKRFPRVKDLRMKGRTGVSFGGYLEAMKLVRARRGPERKIVGFRVASYEPTCHARKIVEEVDGILFVSDPYRVW